MEGLAGLGYLILVNVGVYVVWRITLPRPRREWGAPRLWRLRLRLYGLAGRLLGREVGACENCAAHPWTIRLLPRQ
jgi:hypothetical protein